MSKLFKTLLGAAMTFATIAPATAGTLVERFDEPFAGWKDRFFGARTNAQNYYRTEPSGAPADFRGGNVDGLWISDGGNYLDGGTEWANVRIRFDQDLAQSLTGYSMDVVSLLGAFAPVTLTYFDGNGAILRSFVLPEGTISPNGNPMGYLNYAVTSSNGISGFDLTGFAQGSVSVDNIVAVVPEPASWAMMIGGMGLAGGTLRRRQRTLATVAA